MGELFSTENHPREQQDAQVTIQHIVDAVVDEVGGGRDAEAARERLEAGIAAGGLPPQPESWVRNTAAEIAAGRVVVVDRRLDANARERAGTVREGGEGGEGVGNVERVNRGDSEQR
jgi:hypothetical protein